MQLRDAARSYGRVVILIPLVLIFLTTADSAFACPGHNNGAAKRTRVKAKSVMPTTVISYRTPATYRRCGNSLYDTRGSRYVASRGNGRYNADGAKYLTIRNGSGYYKAAPARKIAVRDIDYDDDVRYVRVRNKVPRTRYVAVRDIDYDDDIRYVRVRNVPRTRYIAVRDIDDDDDVRYVRTYVPRTRYVVSDIRYDDDVRYVRAYTPRTRTVAVRNADTGCIRAVRLRSCLDDVETVSTRQVVIRDDTGYSDEVSYAPITNAIDTGDGYITAAPTVSRVEYTDATYGNGEMFTGTQEITYAPVSYRYDDDIDRIAFMDGGDAAFVAADDIEDACLSGVAVGTPREVVSAHAVSYVPVEDFDDNAMYLETEDVDSAPLIRHVAVDEVEEVAFDDTDSISYVPVGDMDTVVEELPVEMDTDADVRYVVADNVCPIAAGELNVEPVYIADTSTVFVDSDAELVGTNRIAADFGYRDGFEDGRDAALEGDVYHPENSGDFKKATEGYEDDFGDKDVYKDSYRDSYLDGYQAGFESALSTA